MAPCPVCANGRTRFFSHEGNRDYLCCGDCAAVFLHPSQLPASEAERDRYTRHENDPADEGYRQFLLRLAQPLLARLPARRSGLDYGCGPGPALASMLSDAGHTVALYDPFFYPDPDALNREYDFITCTEAVEHFRRPAEEFARLDRLLKPGGLLAIMTSFLTDDTSFADWHYRHDLTHIVFYRPETFGHIAARHGWDCDIPAKDIVFMQKRLLG